MPNAAVPFSFIAMTNYKRSVCLPVYEANAGAGQETYELYGHIFGKTDLLEFLKLSILGKPTDAVTKALGEKCIALVAQIASSKKRKNGLTEDGWRAAYSAISAGGNLPEYLNKNARINWKKRTSICITHTARCFMEVGASYSFGLTSADLPLSFVPKNTRPIFSEKVRDIYPAVGDEFVNFLASDSTHLVIAWLNGFKGKGDDARPDRGLPPLARMLIGDGCDLMTFVFGPALPDHWVSLDEEPRQLANKNGLWAAILAVSDGVLVDSTTIPDNTPRGSLVQ